MIIDNQQLCFVFKPGDWFISTRRRLPLSSAILIFLSSTKAPKVALITRVNRGLGVGLVNGFVAKPDYVGSLSSPQHELE